MLGAVVVFRGLLLDNKDNRMDEIWLLLSTFTEPSRNDVDAAKRGVRHTCSLHNFKRPKADDRKSNCLNQSNHIFSVILYGKVYPTWISTEQTKTLPIISWQLKFGRCDCTLGINWAIYSRRWTPNEYEIMITAHSFLFSARWKCLIYIRRLTAVFSAARSTGRSRKCQGLHHCYSPGKTSFSRIS